MGGDAALAEPLAEVVRDPLGEPARVDEDERGPVRPDERGEPVVDLAPLLVGRDRLELAVGELDREVERAAVAEVDDLAGRGAVGRSRRARADEEPRDRLDRPLRSPTGRCAGAAVGQRLEPLQRERQVGAPLVARHRVDLVHDHRPHAGGGTRGSGAAVSSR